MIPWDHTANDVFLGSAIFAGIANVSNTQTDTQTTLHLQQYAAAYPMHAMRHGVFAGKTV